MHTCVLPSDVLVELSSKCSVQEDMLKLRQQGEYAAAEPARIQA